jgi:hypothetical protein
MAEVLVSFGSRIQGPDGRSYAVQASGRERDDGLWEGWLEFLPVDGSAPVVTGRETTQPNRKDLLYWATGLTDPYMDGALARTLKRPPERVAAPWPGPAATAPADSPDSQRAQRTPRTAILDPFHVYAEGVDVLRSQLRALSADQLRNIVTAHALAVDLDTATLDRMDRSELAALILLGVERRMK